MSRDSVLMSRDSVLTLRDNLPTACRGFDGQN